MIASGRRRDVFGPRFDPDAPEVEAVGVPAGPDGQIFAPDARRVVADRQDQFLGPVAAGLKAGDTVASDGGFRDLGGTRAMLRVAVLVQPLRVVQLGEDVEDQEVDRRLPRRDVQAGQSNALPVVRAVIVAASGQAHRAHRRSRRVAVAGHALAARAQRPAAAQASSSSVRTSSNSPVICRSGSSRLKMSLRLR